MRIIDINHLIHNGYIISMIPDTHENPQVWQPHFHSGSIIKETFSELMLGQLIYPLPGLIYSLSVFSLTIFFIIVL